MKNKPIIVKPSAPSNLEGHAVKTICISENVKPYESLLTKIENPDWLLFLYPQEIEIVEKYDKVFCLTKALDTIRNEGSKNQFEKLIDSICRTFQKILIPNIDLDSSAKQLIKISVFSNANSQRSSKEFCNGVKEICNIIDTYEDCFLFKKDFGLAVALIKGQYGTIHG